MTELVAYKGVVVLAALALLLLAERAMPAVPVPPAFATHTRLAKNVSLWVCNSLVSLMIVLPVTLYASSQAHYWWSGWVPRWTWLPLDLLILDLWIYWWHRASHRIPVLWRFHRVHHLDQWLDVTSAVRFHFGEVVLSALARSVVIFCFAIPITSVIIFEALVLIFTAFHHSNVRLPRRLEQGLSLVVITPSIHWVHHHVEQRDTDSNYGTLSSFWDSLFRSRSKTPRSPDMAIGLDHLSDQGLWQLLLSPFRRQSQRREEVGLP